MGIELHMKQIELYGNLFGQDPWKFLLDFSNKGAIEINSYYIKFISRKESIESVSHSYVHS